MDLLGSHKVDRDAKGDLFRLKPTQQSNRMQLFYVVTMMYWFALYIYVPILGPYVQHLGGSLRMVGLVVGSYGFTQMLFRIPLGIFSDRLRRRKLFVSIGVALALLSSLGMGLVSNPWLVFLFRSLAGAAAATWVAFTVLFSSYFPKEDAPKAMGVIVFYTFVGQMIATTLGGFAADSLGWQAPFIIGSLVGAVGLLLSRRIVENRTAVAQPIEVKELLQVGKDRALLSVAFLAILLQCLTFSTVYGFTPSYAAGIGASKSELSILALVSTLPAAFSSLKSGDWAKRFGERNLLVISFLITACFSAIIPFVRTVWWLYITQALGGFGRGMIFPVLMGLSIQFVDGHKRATAMGFFQSIYSLGMFGGPVLVGFIGDTFSLTGGFITVGVIGVVAAFLASHLLHASRLDRQAVTSA